MTSFGRRTLHHKPTQGAAVLMGLDVVVVALAPVVCLAGFVVTGAGVFFPAKRKRNFVLL